MAHESVDQLLKAVRMGVPGAYLSLFDRYYSRNERYAHCLCMMRPPPRVQLQLRSKLASVKPVVNNPGTFPIQRSCT